MRPHADLTFRPPELLLLAFLLGQLQEMFDVLVVGAEVLANVFVHAIAPWAGLKAGLYNPNRQRSMVLTVNTNHRDTEKL